MPLSTKKTFFDEYVFEVCDNVYEPSEDSFFFAENLHLQAEARVLDVGTGSGILGIIASKNAREVIFIDLNPYSIRCARQNVSINKVTSDIKFIQSDLFSSLTETTKFDVILFNAPYVPTEQGEEESWIGHAWAGGTTGRQVIDRFISTAPKQLESSGEIFLMQSNLANVEETQEKFLSLGLETKVVSSLRLAFFETLFLLRVSFISARET
jgi:release factor glutamine methyltransferase